MVHPRNLWPVLMFGALLLAWGFTGCTPAPAPGIAELKAQIAELKESVGLVHVEAVAANQKLDELGKRRIIIPFGSAADITPERIRAAIGFQLKSAGALIGNDKVVGFFEDMASDIRKTVAPVDLGGALDKQARKLGGDRINQLLSQ